MLPIFLFSIFLKFKRTLTNLRTKKHKKMLFYAKKTKIIAPSSLNSGNKEKLEKDKKKY